VYHRDRDSRRCRRYLHQAQECVDRLRYLQPDLAANASVDLDEWRRLTWTAPEQSMIASSLWRSRRGSRARWQEVPGVLGQPVAGNVPALPGAGWGDFRADDSFSPRSMVPPGGPVRSATPALDAGSEVLGGRIVRRPQAGPPRGTDPQRYLSDFRIASLRRMLRQEPANARVVNELGRALEERAELERRLRGGVRGGSESLRYPYLRKAAAVYLEAARRSPLRIYQGTFYAAAADIQGRLQRRDEQYRLLKRALERVPFAPALYRELQATCLRTGRFAESRMARRSADEWSLPGLKMVQ
jgi:hypothetical protein